MPADSLPRTGGYSWPARRKEAVGIIRHIPHRGQHYLGRGQGVEAARTPSKAHDLAGRQRQESSRAVVREEVVERVRAEGDKAAREDAA